MTDEEIITELEHLRACARQQPLSYLPLFDAAMKIAASQFKRAIEAERKLAEVGNGSAGV